MKHPFGCGRAASMSFAIVVAGLLLASPVVAKKSSRPMIVSASTVGGRTEPADVIVRAPKLSRCRLVLSIGRRPGSTSASKAPGSSGDVEFSWAFPANASPGTWVATVHCRGFKRSLRVKIKVNGGASKRAGPGHIAINATSLSSTSLPQIRDHRTVGAKGGGGYPAYGTPILAGRDWFGGRGVTVYSDGGSGFDGHWQCVELFERFMEAQRWIPGLVGGGDAGAVNLFSDARLSTYFVKHPNGSGYSPVPGDAVIFSHGTFGHVAIVDSVGGGQVNLVEQNASASGRTSISIRGSTLGADGVEIPVGVLHAKGDASPPATTPPSTPPTGPPAVSGLVFPVQNTNSPPPDGVYFRNSPHNPDTSSIAGLGVYAGEHVHPICYAYGDAVGPYSDQLWYEVNNVTRPTVNGASDSGWLNAHYINDGEATNQVDSGVAVCAGYSSSPPSGSTPPTPARTPAPVPTPAPTPAPTTYAETAGGVAHTWTNYTNAGGIQGPSIGSNATVQIACTIAGFAVADGNTWWYRIASAPWSSSYYVSADAFYNNGQTSGSLHGTPFVDPAVPGC